MYCFEQSLFWNVTNKIAVYFLWKTIWSCVKNLPITEDDANTPTQKNAASLIQISPSTPPLSLSLSLSLSLIRLYLIFKQKFISFVAFSTQYNMDSNICIAERMLDQSI